MRESAGTGTVVGRLTATLTDLFESVALAIVSLVIFRDGLRARLRQRSPAGVPLLTEATAMIASYLVAYLVAERERGRIAAGAAINTLAPTLTGPGTCCSPAAKASRAAPVAYGDGIRGEDGSVPGRAA